MQIDIMSLVYTVGVLSGVVGVVTVLVLGQIWSKNKK